MGVDNICEEGDSSVVDVYSQGDRPDGQITLGVDEDSIGGSIPLHYELVPLQPFVSKNVISAFQQGHQTFPLVKLKITNGNTYSHTYHICKSFGGRI
jgi:hypothetical protein